MNLATVKRGDTWIFSFVWKSNGTPIDLSDCTARMQVRKKRFGDLLAEVNSTTDIVIDGGSGTVTVTFPAELTADVEPGQHDTDLQITFASTGEVRSSQTLTLTVLEDITR